MKPNQPLVNNPQWCCLVDEYGRYYLENGGWVHSPKPGQWIAKFPDKQSARRVAIFLRKKGVKANVRFLT